MLDREAGQVKEVKLLEDVGTVKINNMQKLKAKQNRAKAMYGSKAKKITKNDLFYGFTKKASKIYKPAGKNINTGEILYAKEVSNFLPNNSYYTKYRGIKSPAKSKSTLKNIAKNLKKSSKVHAKQSKQIESIMKNKASALKLKKSPALAKLSASCKAAAKRKFKVYPSAYANMWAAKTQRQGMC